MTLKTILFLIFALGWSANSQLTSRGYIIYCPCMGRFGNQAEQLLGSLQFAHHLNRTLVLPPFIKYNYHDIEFIPFQDIFDVDAIREYTDVITLEDFMAT